MRRTVTSGREGSWHQDAAIDVRQARTPTECHREVELFMDDLQRLGDPSLAHCAKAIQKCTTNIGTLGAQSNGFQYVLTAAYATVNVHLDLIAHSGDDTGQNGDARLGAVQLATPMVRDDQRIGARGDGQSGIFLVENAFNDELATPALFDPFHIAPIELGVKLFGSPV